MKRDKKAMKEQEKVEPVNEYANKEIYIMTHQQDIDEKYKSLSRVMSQNFYDKQREMFKLRKPYVEKAVKEQEALLKKKLTQQRLNTLIKKISNSIPQIKLFTNTVNEFGDKSQSFINSYGRIKQAIIFKRPLTNEMIDWLYNNIIYEL